MHTKNILAQVLCHDANSEAFSSLLFTFQVEDCINENDGNGLAVSVIISTTVLTAYFFKKKFVQNDLL